MSDPVLRINLPPGAFGAGVDQAVEKLRERGDAADYKLAYENLRAQHEQAVGNQRDNTLLILAHIDAHPAMARRMCENVIEWCEDNGAEPVARRPTGPVS